jgi:hypothetical protein
MLRVLNGKLNLKYLCRNEINNFLPTKVGSVERSPDEERCGLL